VENRPKVTWQKWLHGKWIRRGTSKMDDEETGLNVVVSKRVIVHHYEGLDE
jgi:hypothetical protein